MHDKIFEHQREMSPDNYLKYAGELGLDVDQFKGDLKSATVKGRIDGDKKLASSLGVTGTPAFFINGRYLSGNQPFPAFQKMIDTELAKN
jgi:protein-disulfide isomerase